MHLYIYRCLDEKTGFRSCNCLCQPVRGNKGGGGIVAIVQMLNKLADGGVAAPSHAQKKSTTPGSASRYIAFDAQDEETVALCVQRVADDLSDRFAELLLVGEHFCGCAILVRSDTVQNHEQNIFGTAPAKRYLGSTAASKGHKSHEFNSAALSDSQSYDQPDDPFPRHIALSKF